MGKRIPLSDELPLGIVVTDGDGLCLYSNGAYQTLCGWSSEELIGSHWSAVIYQPDHDKAILQWETAMSGHDGFPFETRLEANTLLIAKNGVKLAIEDSAAPIRNRFGVITGSVIVFRDARLSRETTSRTHKFCS